jgi:hypothetical protein
MDDTAIYDAEALEAAGFTEKQIRYLLSRSDRLTLDGRPFLFADELERLLPVHLGGDARGDA